MLSPVGKFLRKCNNILRLSFAEFSSLPDLNTLNVVRTVEKVIDNNTSVFIESPVHVKIQPIDVNDISAHNKLTMRLYSKGKDTTDFQLKQSSKRLELSNKTSSSGSNDVCVIEVPYQLKVNVSTTKDASVHMSKMEGEELSIKTVKGNIIVGDLKSQSIKLESMQGTINTNGRLQASNIDIKTGEHAGIHCHNIMSNSLNISTHAGPISVKSCYSDTSHFTTALGNMKLDHIHKLVIIDVIQNGNLDMMGFSGTLKATLKSGNVFIHAAQLIDKSSIFIHEKGKVELQVSEILKNLPATNLIAETIKVDDTILKKGRFMDDSHPQRFRFEGEPNNELHIVCRNGSIDLRETFVPFVV